MANALRGEVDLVIGENAFTLCFTTNAIVEVETVAGKDIGTVLGEWQASPAYAPLRMLLWGATRKHHPSLSLLDAGDMLDDLGTDRMEALGELIGKALRFRLSGISVDAPIGSEPGEA